MIAPANFLQAASAFEREIVRLILRREAPEYEDHLNGLRIARREHTGVGMFLYFAYLSPAPGGRREDMTLGTKVRVEIDGLNDGAGAVLHIRAGEIVLLEIFSYGNEPLPDPIPDWTLPQDWCLRRHPHQAGRLSQFA